MWIENWLREEKETQKKDREEPEQKNLAEKKQEEKESGKNYTEEKNYRKESEGKKIDTRVPDSKYNTGKKNTEVGREIWRN